MAFLGGLGGIIGYMFGFWSIFLGFFIGVLVYRYFFKILSLENFKLLFKKNKKLQQEFFKTTFLVMGKLAKIDGIINIREIQVAKEWMYGLKMDEQQKSEARFFFNEGKKPETDISPSLNYLNKNAPRELKKFFIEIQLSVAYSDAAQEISITEMQFLKDICSDLGLNFRIFNYIHGYFKLQKNIKDEYNRFNENRIARLDTIQRSYRILDVSSKSSDAEIKKSYRKLMNEHHPDKLVSKGLPESMISVAKQKTQEIQSAYDKIKKHRKK